MSHTKKKRNKKRHTTIDSNNLPVQFFITEGTALSDTKNVNPIDKSSTGCLLANRKYNSSNIVKS